MKPEEKSRGPLAFHRPLFGGALIAFAAVAAYANTFGVPFVFDDIGSIVDNPTIRQLWPPSKALSPPPDWGFTVSGRPVLNFSFALNYAISGLEVWSYHALNLLIHILAGLTLFGLLRRTMARPIFAMRSATETVWLPVIVAAVWTLHPLQTESVTYVVQRAESLMGFFFLLTLYAFVRSLDASNPGRWRAVAVGACLLGVGTKEVAALAPLVAFLYDRTFVAGNFRDAWRQRRGFYLSLAATWLPLAWLLAGTGGNRGGTVGFDVGVAWSSYWATQLEAVCRYLALSFWPNPLVFEYGRILPGNAGETFLRAILVLGLIAATMIALRRWPVAGFLGACFFGLLAPTSIVPSASQVIVEHRMYLPLAAVVALACGGLARRLGVRIFMLAGLALTVAAGAATGRRNFFYRSEEALWADTVAKRPNNARAYNNLGLAYYKMGQIDAAVARYRRSLELDPGSAQVHYNLGLALMTTGRLAEAADCFRAAVRILPYYFNAHLNLGIVLTRSGQPQQALAHFTEAIRFDPSPAEAHFHFGVALASLGRWQEAIQHYAFALKVNPTHAAAHANWGVALFQLNDAAAAIEHFTAALRLKPDLPGVHFNLGLASASLGRLSDAIGFYSEAVRLDEQSSDAELNLGIALAQAGRLPDAVPHLERAVSLSPNSISARTNLATALAGIPGRAADALLHYETALKLQPNDARAHYNVGYALLVVGRWNEARASFEHALRLQPGLSAAQEMLDQIKARRGAP